MRRTVMTLAWKVFKVSTYTFSTCLKAAWKAVKENTTDNFNVWCKYGKVRIYFGNKFCEVVGKEREFVLKDYSIKINTEKNKVSLPAIKEYCDYLENTAKSLSDKSENIKKLISAKIYKLREDLEAYRSKKMIAVRNLIMIGRYLVYPLSLCVKKDEVEEFKNKVENY